MAGKNKKLLRAGLEGLYFSGAHLLLRPLLGGLGAILMLHHVRPPRVDAFQPNRLLEVTPAFFEDVVRHLKRSRVDIITLDEMHHRLTEGRGGRRFVCLTFDDGYRDNLIYAYPILKKYQVPFCLYVPTSFPDRLGDLWWLTLERVIATQPRIGMVMDGEERRFICTSTEQKYEVFEHVYWWLRSLETEDELRVAVNDLAHRYGVDPKAFCDELCMTWTELDEIAADPLTTIGAHTVSHIMLRKANADVARREMMQGASVLEAAFGKRPRHFAYPVGDPTSAGPRDFKIAAELGFKTAVTTRPGVVFPEHRAHLTALPRISLNGEYQRLRYAKALMSGVPTALWNRLRRVSVD